MKKKTTISVDEKIIQAMKEKGVNISQFCEEQMKEFLKIAKIYDLTTEIEMIEDQKRKLDQKLYQINKYMAAKHELNDFNHEKCSKVWDEFIEEFDNWYYASSHIIIDEVVRISGLQVPQLERLGLFISDYHGEDVEKVKKNVDYAIMKYNEINVQPIARSGGYSW